MRFLLHASEELLKEGFDEGDAIDILERPTYDKDGTAFRRKRGKTLIIRYRTRDSYILIHGCSATKRKLPGL